MGRALLVGRLGLRDLRRHRGQAALVVLAIMAATTTLTLGLVLHEVTNAPYQRTREATAGPDLVASVAPPADGIRSADVGLLHDLADQPGVVAHGGPYPVATLPLEANGHTAPAQAEGRSSGPVAAVDRPELTEGSWIAAGGVVVEATFAAALDVAAGDEIVLGGRTFRVRGVAVSAALEEWVPATLSPTKSPWPADEADEAGEAGDGGRVWMTEADIARLAPVASHLSYVLHLRLADPASAPDFAAAFVPSPPPDVASLQQQSPLHVSTWQDILDRTSNLVRNERRALMTGSWLLGLLAAASVAVLVGGRLADQTRRVGLLKAVGGTPGLVAVVLLAEHLVVALVAATAGLALGWGLAPLLTDPGVGVLGTASAPPLSLATAGLVIAAALVVVTAATAVPAVRAARTSTVRALAGDVRPPRRTAWLIALSARLPAALLVGLRVAARRPRRVVLSATSIAVTVTGIVAVMAAQAQLHGQRDPAASSFEDLRTDRLTSVLLVITAMLVALAAVNAVFISWTTVLDAQRSSALARTLGVTPRQMSAGLAAAQTLPALAGAVLGIPAGLVLFGVLSPDEAPDPSTAGLLAVLPATVVLVAVLAAIPARLGTRRPVTDVLHAELA